MIVATVLQEAGMSTQEDYQHNNDVAEILSFVVMWLSVFVPYVQFDYCNPPNNNIQLQEGVFKFSFARNVYGPLMLIVVFLFYKVYNDARVDVTLCMAAWIIPPIHSAALFCSEIMQHNTRYGICIHDTKLRQMSWNIKNDKVGIKYIFYVFVLIYAIEIELFFNNPIPGFGFFTEIQCPWMVGVINTVVLCGVSDAFNRNSNSLTSNVAFVFMILVLFVMIAKPLYWEHAVQLLPWSVVTKPIHTRAECDINTEVCVSNPTSPSMNIDFAKIIRLFENIDFAEIIRLLENIDFSDINRLFLTCNTKICTQMTLKKIAKFLVVKFLPQGFLNRIAILPHWLHLAADFVSFFALNELTPDLYCADSRPCLEN